MAQLFELPIIPDLFDYKYEVSLDGVVYLINLRYNERMDTWFFSLHDRADVLLIGGIALKMGVDLLNHFSYIPGVPPGRFVVVNFDDKEEANLDTLGSKVIFAYIGDS